MINYLQFTKVGSRKGMDVTWALDAIIPVNSPGFDCNLPVSRFPFFISQFLSQNNILVVFQNNHANQFVSFFITYLDSSQMKNSSKENARRCCRIIDSSDDETDNRSSTNICKRKLSYPIKEVKNNKFKFHCIQCGKDLSCRHQCLEDVKDHCSKPSHLQAHSALKKQSLLPSSFTSENSFKQQKVLNA